MTPAPAAYKLNSEEDNFESSIPEEVEFEGFGSPRRTGNFDNSITPRSEKPYDAKLPQSEFSEFSSDLVMNKAPDFAQEDVPAEGEPARRMHPSKHFDDYSADLSIVEEPSRILDQKSPNSTGESDSIGPLCPQPPTHDGISDSPTEEAQKLSSLTVSLNTDSVKPMMELGAGINHSLGSINSIPPLAIGPVGNEYEGSEEDEDPAHISPITSTPIADEFDSSLIGDEGHAILGNDAGRVAAKIAADAEFLENTFKDEDLIVSVSEQPELTNQKSETSEDLSAAAAGSALPTANSEKMLFMPQHTLPEPQISQKESVTVIATTEGDKYVTIEWAKKSLRVNRMKVKFKNCSLRNIWKSTVPILGAGKNAAEWRVLLQLKTYTNWTVTMCLQYEVYSARILERLCEALGDKKFNLDLAESPAGGMPIAKFDRPHTGQIESRFDLQICRLHLSSESLPNELRASLLQTYNIPNPEQWWMNICCAKPKIDRGLPIDDSNAQVLEAASKGVELFADGVYALRSLILVADASECSENQIKLTGRVIRLITGNDHRFEAFGFYDRFGASVLSKYLNGKRARDVRPIRTYTNSALQPTFICRDEPVPPNGVEEWNEIKNSDLEKRMIEISGYYQSALRGQWFCQHAGSPAITSPRADDSLQFEEWLTSTEKTFGSVLNPANLVGDPRLDPKRSECIKFLSRFRFPHIPEKGIQSILGVSLGRARAMMSLIEQGTSHHALLLHTNNMKLGFLDMLGLDRTLMHRWSIPSAALVLVVLGIDGIPVMILGDAGATLTNVCETLTFAPVVNSDRSLTEPKSSRIKLLQSELISDLRVGNPNLSKSAVGKRIILLRHGQNYQHNNRDFGLSGLGRSQLEATAEWLADSMTNDHGLINKPKTWSAAGLSTDACTIKASLQESLNIVRTIFVSRLPLSASESIFGEDSAIYEPENLFRVTSGIGTPAIEGCELHILISDEYHLLKYFGVCFGLSPSQLCSMRIPHAGFIAINVNSADDFAWCPSFGMVAHIPPSLITSVA